MRYDESREEMVRLVPPSTRRVLDVGCASGRFGQEVRQALPETKIWGIDPLPSVESTEGGYEVVVRGSFPDDLPRGVKFDCICFNDVLEHMLDPWAALRETHQHVEQGAVVLASIPNVRHWQQVLRPLITEGRWDYREFGVLDRTHLRFFTRSSAVAMFEECGYSVREVSGIRFQPSAGKLALMNRVMSGRFDDFLAERFAVVATARD